VEFLGCLRVLFGFDRREQAVVSLAPDGHKILFLCHVREKCQMCVANILQPLPVMFYSLPISMKN